MQNVRHIAQFTGHTTQKDSLTMQNVCRNTLNVCQEPKGGLEVPTRAPGGPLPLYMKKLQCLETITKRYNSHFHSENSISFHIPQSGRNFIVQSKLQFCDKISFQMLKHLQIDVLIFSQMIRFTSEKTDINDRYDI